MKTNYIDECIKNVYKNKMDKEVQKKFADVFSSYVNEICRRNSLKELTDYVNAYAFEDKTFNEIGYCGYCTLSLEKTKRLFKNNSCSALCIEFIKFDKFIDSCCDKHKIGYYLLVSSLKMKLGDNLLDIE